MNEKELTPLMKGETVLCEAKNAPRKKNPWLLFVGLLLLALGTAFLLSELYKTVALSAMIGGGILTFPGVYLFARSKTVRQSLILTNERLVFTDEQGKSYACALDAITLLVAKSERLEVRTAGGMIVIHHLAEARSFMKRLDEEILEADNESVVNLTADAIVHNPLEDMMKEEEQAKLALNEKDALGKAHPSYEEEKKTILKKKKVTLDLSKAKKEANASPLDARQIVEDKLAAKKALEEANAERH